VPPVKRIVRAHRQPRSSNKPVIRQPDRSRRDPAPRRAWLSAAPVPFAALQPTRGWLWWEPREPHTLSAWSLWCGTRRLPSWSSRYDARVRHRL